MCQSQCACLHQTLNMVVSFVKSNEKTYTKGSATLQMYRVVPITKRRNCIYTYCSTVHCYRKPKGQSSRQTSMFQKTHAYIRKRNQSVRVRLLFCN